MSKLPFLGLNEGQPSFARLCMSHRQYDSYRTHFMTKTYPSGQCIHYQGEEITYFGIVTEGVLKAVQSSRDGAELCNAYFEQEDSFPEFLYFTGKRRYTYDLYVEKKATVLWIPISILEEMLDGDTQLMSALLLYTSKNLSTKQVNISRLGCHRHTFEIHQFM